MPDSAPLLGVQSFGGIDADADDLLGACFQDHEAYAAARDHERFVIVGRKGSGKTAIFKKLIKTTRPDAFTFGHTFSDYPWPHHDLQARSGVADEDRYTHSWKYLILLSAAKILLNQDESQPWSDSAMAELGRLERFVVDSYGSRDPDLTQVFSPAKRLRIRPALNIGSVGLQAGVSLESLPLSELPVIVQEVNRNIAIAVAESLNPKHHYYVCFDQLDIGFEADNRTYSSRLVGLLRAARDLTLLARDGGKHFSVVVFLRDDIYQVLRFEDKNKITENYLSRIEWDAQGSEWTLRRLMQKRFSQVLGIDEGDAWSQVFDETQEMPGRQNKYQHILSRTFRRPRDIIRFCNEVLAIHKRNGGDGQRFTNADINAARDGYSSYLLQELDDEVFKHVPSYESFIDVIRAIGKDQFGETEFFEAFSQRAGSLPEEVSATSALKQLFEFSVVGYYAAGGGGGGSGYVWRYLDPRARFDDAATAFRVHPGFKEVLGLKMGRRPGSNEVGEEE